MVDNIFSTICLIRLLQQLHRSVTLSWVQWIQGLSWNVKAAVTELLQRTLLALKLCALFSAYYSCKVGCQCSSADPCWMSVGTSCGFLKILKVLQKVTGTHMGRTKLLIPVRKYDQWREHMQILVPVFLNDV